MGAFSCLFHSICILVIFNWKMRVCLMSFAGLSASISASPPNSPSSKTHPVSASSSPSSDKCFSHSDALASSSYFNRMSRALPDGIHNNASALSRHSCPSHTLTLFRCPGTTSTSAHRRSSLLSSQYSGSLMQVTELRKTHHFCLPTANLESQTYKL